MIGAFLQGAPFALVVAGALAAGSASADESSGKLRLSDSALAQITAGATATIIGAGDAAGAGADGSTASVDVDLSGETNGPTAVVRGVVIAKATGVGAGAAADTVAVVVPIANISRSGSRTLSGGRPGNVFSTTVAYGFGFSTDNLVRP